MVMHDCNPQTWEVEAGDHGIKGIVHYITSLNNITSLVCMRPYLKILKWRGGYI